MPPCAELAKLFDDFSPTFPTAATCAAIDVGDVGAATAVVVVAILGKRLQWVHFAAEQISNNNNNKENVALLYECMGVRLCECALL